MPPLRRRPELRRRTVTLTGRTSIATAEALGLQVTPFPTHHGGFLGGEGG